MFEVDHTLLVQAAMPVCTRYGLALAGGYAIKAHGLVDRHPTTSISPLDT